jgi:hypothetical protein
MSLELGLFIAGVMLISTGTFWQIIEQRRERRRSGLSDSWKESNLSAHEEDQRKRQMTPAAGRDY